MLVGRELLLCTTGVYYQVRLWSVISPTGTAKEWFDFSRSGNYPTQGILYLTITCCISLLEEIRRNIDLISLSRGTKVCLHKSRLTAFETTTADRRFLSCWTSENQFIVPTPRGTISPDHEPNRRPINSRDGVTGRKWKRKEENQGLGSWDVKTRKLGDQIRSQEKLTTDRGVGMDSTGCGILGHVSPGELLHSRPVVPEMRPRGIHELLYLYLVESSRAENVPKRPIFE